MSSRTPTSSSSGREKQPDILAAWENARDSKLYLNVRDVETGKRLASAYALGISLNSSPSSRACIL